MKKYCVIAAALVAAMPAVCGRSLTLSEVAGRLAAVSCYADSCTYEVLLASLSEPVSYSIALESSLPGQPDTLSPCDYMIEWSLPTPSGISKGFSAYAGGSHFRFRDGRMQEYHYSDSAEPFAPSSDVSRGVQRQVQFGDLLPQFIGAHFAEMERDSTYIYKLTADTIVSGRPSTVIEGVRRAGGYDGSEYVYILDRETLLPLRIELENNPGQIGEQSIAVTYHGFSAPDDCRPLTTDVIAARQPEAFGRYRESTFTLRSLPGTPLPEINAPAIDGTRYSRARGEATGTPAVIAILDSSVDTTPALIDDLRAAVGSLPMQAELVLAFTDHRPDQVEALTGAPQPGEAVLFNSRGIAARCGAGSLTPVLIFVSPDGTVSDFNCGYNTELRSVVIQKTVLAGSAR